MSELKATTVYDAYWKANSVGEGTGILVYLKSEADKVISELKAENAKLEGILDVWNTYKILGDTYKKLRRQKYKRCLAMAKYCHESAMWLEEYGVTKSTTFMLRWEKRWLELAEKFKEAK